MSAPSYSGMSLEAITQLRDNLAQLDAEAPTRMCCAVAALDEVIRLRKNLQAITAAGATNPQPEAAQAQADRYAELEERVRAIESFLVL